MTSVQAVAFAVICVLAFLVGRRALGDRAGLTAAALVALFSPLPYFGAMVLTELWTAFVATAAMLQCFRAVQRRGLGDFILAGDDAQFSDTHAKLGLTSGWGLSQRLSRRIGVQR